MPLMASSVDWCVQGKTWSAWSYANRNVQTERTSSKKKKQTHDSRRPELQKSKDKEKILQVPGGGKTPFKPQG